MSRLKLTFGGIAIFAMLLATAKIYTLYACDEICEFTEIFKKSNLNMSATGKVPKWPDDIDLCIYGDDINESTLAISTEAIRFYSTVIKKEISYSHQPDVTTCSLNTEIYMIIVTGRVKRSTVSGNYKKIMERENILIPGELPSSFYQSAFAQTGFLADKSKSTAAILINQISNDVNETTRQYISSGVYEELFQTIAIASDLAANEDIRSVLQEKYVHTPSISSGIYSAQEVQKYLETRPQYLCTFDIMHLILLYESKIHSLEMSDYISFITLQYDDLKQKALKVYSDATSMAGGVLTTLAC